MHGFINLCLTGGAVGGADWVPVGVYVVACWMAAASAFDNTLTSTDTVAGLCAIWLVYSAS